MEASVQPERRGMEDWKGKAASKGSYPWKLQANPKGTMQSSIIDNAIQIKAELGGGHVWIQTIWQSYHSPVWCMVYTRYSYSKGLLVMSSTRGQTQQQQFQFRGKCIGEKHIISITGGGGRPANISCNSRQLCAPLSRLPDALHSREGPAWTNGEPCLFLLRRFHWQPVFCWHVIWKCVGKNRHDTPPCTCSSLPDGQAPCRAGERPRPGTYKASFQHACYKYACDQENFSYWNLKTRLTNPAVKDLLQATFTGWVAERGRFNSLLVQTNSVATLTSQGDRPPALLLLIALSSCIRSSKCYFWCQWSLFARKCALGLTTDYRQILIEKQSPKCYDGQYHQPRLQVQLLEVWFLILFASSPCLGLSVII